MCVQTVNNTLMGMYNSFNYSVTIYETKGESKIVCLSRFNNAFARSTHNYLKVISANATSTMSPRTTSHCMILWRSNLLDFELMISGGNWWDDAVSARLSKMLLFISFFYSFSWESTTCLSSKATPLRTVYNPPAFSFLTFSSELYIYHHCIQTS